MKVDENPNYGQAGGMMDRKLKKFEYYPKVGYARAKELYVKYNAPLRVLTKGGRETDLRDVIQEGIVKEFIDQFIPTGYNVHRGVVYDSAKKGHSSEINAIVYTDTPLMNFSDVVVTDQKQTTLVVEVRSWAKIADLFGNPIKDKKGKTVKDERGLPKRDSKTDLQSIYKDHSNYGEKFVLFIFSLEVTKKIPDEEIYAKLSELSDKWVVVWRKSGKHREFDYGNSVSKFIEELKNLGN